MTLSLWFLLGGYIIGVAPFAVVAAYLYEQHRSLVQALKTAQTALARCDALIAERHAAGHPSATLQALVVPGQAPFEAGLEPRAAAHASAYLVLCHIALMLQRNLALSRAEILRLDTELRRRPARESVLVTPEEWATIVAAAEVHRSRRAVARAVFGNSGKHTYSKVKYVCDAQGLLLRDEVSERRRPGALSLGAVSESAAGTSAPASVGATARGACAVSAVAMRDRADLT